MTDLLTFHTPADTRRRLAERVRERRRALGLSRDRLAERSGVPAPTIKRFETRAEISLRQFLQLWHVVGDLGDLDALLNPEPPVPRSIDDIVPP